MVAGSVIGRVVHGAEVPESGGEGWRMREADHGEAVGVGDEGAGVDCAVEGAVAVEVGVSFVEGIELEGGIER